MNNSGIAIFFECGQCKNIFYHTNSDELNICPFCGLQKLKKMETQLEIPPIELIIKDQLTANESKDTYANFIKPVRFCSPGLNVEELTRNTRKLYQPFWLVDSSAKGNWTATFGYNYQVESSKETYDNNQWISKKIEETRVDWEQRNGLIERDYQNILINSLRKQDWLTKIVGKYDLSKPSKLLNTNTVETLIFPDINPSTGWQDTLPKFEKLIQNDCQKAANAQHVKAFATHIDYSSINWTLILTPYYHSYYFDETGESHSVWINSQTKNINGERIASQKSGNKWGLIYIACSIFFFILGIIFASFSNDIQFFHIFSPLSLIAFLILLVLSAYSFIYPWQYNKKNRDYRFDNFYK